MKVADHPAPWPPGLLTPGLFEISLRVVADFFAGTDSGASTMSLQKSHIALGAAVLGLAVAAFASVPAMALTAKECGEKYQAAKAANTLGGLNYNAFRRAQCGTDAAPAAAAAPANPLRPQPAAATRPAPSAPAPAPAAAGQAVFPKAVDPKYSTLRPAQQRLKTCSDQYNANKATNANGGMKWIEKGGGYWSACNKAIKV